jgi:hypothetical protein
MKNEKRSREELSKSIIEIELDMFERVRTAELSLCKDRPETFKVMRGMAHYGLSTETLESYLEDLHKAKAEGRNLLTEKYARMDKIIPPLKTNPIIDDIVEIEARWMEELSEKYPHTFKGGPTFKIYLSCELETYSDKTLELFFEDISKSEKKGRNLTEEQYTMLFQKIGYSSIDEAEKKAGA